MCFFKLIANFPFNVAAFKANNNEDDIAECDTYSVTLKVSEELFPDQGDELYEGASSEVDNFDM